MKQQKEGEIMDGILTIINIVLSFFSLIFSKKQNEKENNINLYDKRKNVYDFLKNSKIDWENCLKYEDKKNPETIVKQVFAKETLGETIGTEELLKIIWKGYKNGIELLEEIENLYKITLKEHILILQLKIAMNEFYNMYIYYLIITRDEKEKQELIKRFKKENKNIVELYNNKESKKLFKKMEKKIKIGWQKKFKYIVKHKVECLNISNFCNIRTKHL